MKHKFAIPLACIALAVPLSGSASPHRVGSFKPATSSLTNNAVAFVGHAGLVPGGGNFDGASMSFTAPFYYESQCHNASFAAWVGVQNNSTGGGLVQTGVLVDSAGAGSTTGAHTFYMFYGGPWDMSKQGPALDQIPYVQGARYYFHVWYHTAHDWGITEENLDNGATFSKYEPTGKTSGGTAYIGQQLGAVEERPTIQAVPPYFTPLMDTTDISFRNVTGHVYGGSNLLLYQSSIGTWDYMVDKEGVKMASTTPVGSTSGFSTHYLACGHKDSAP
jgi:hypothetical protein